MEQVVFITEDGSHSVTVPQLQVTYHSRHGALQESRHIFIESGLKEVLKQKREVSIFEMGFGTGLNALLTLMEDAKIFYETVELYPLPESTIATLNYASLLKRPDLHPVLKQLHTCEWNRVCAITERFQLLKRKENIQDIVFANRFDLVYFDAFDPVAQPQLWDVAIFRNLFQAMNKGGLLLTYCSKGVVRRAMREAGFQVEKIPGPPGKREIVRALVR